MGRQASGPQGNNHRLPQHQTSGGVLEWSNKPVLKTGVVQATVGSNPTPSATQFYSKILLAPYCGIAPEFF